MVDRQFELPVDVRRKSEVVQDRLGLFIILTVVAIFTFLLFLLSVNLGFVLAKGAAALPNVSRSPRLAEAVGRTRNHSPTSAIPLDTQVCMPRRRKYSGTNTT